MVLAFSKRVKGALLGAGVVMALAISLNPSALACCNAPVSVVSVYQTFDCGGTEWWLAWSFQGRGRCVHHRRGRVLGLLGLCLRLRERDRDCD